MFQPERLVTVGFTPRRRPNGLVASVMWLGGLIAGVAAMAVGAILAVFWVTMSFSGHTLVRL